MLKAEWHEGMLRVALLPAPGAREVGDAAVAAGVAVSLDLREQRLGGAAILLDTVGVGRQGQFQHGVKRRQFAGHFATPVARRCNNFGLGSPDPFAQRVAGQPRTLRDFMQRQLVAQVHPSNLA